MPHTQVGAKQNWGGEGIKRWKMTKQGGARPQKSWGPPQTWNSGYANPFLDMLKRATFFLVHTEEFCHLWAQSKTWALKQNLRHSLIFVMALLPWIILWYIHGQSFENHQTNDMIVIPQQHIYTLYYIYLSEQSNIPSVFKIFSRTSRCSLPHSTQRDPSINPNPSIFSTTLHISRVFPNAKVNLFVGLYLLIENQVICIMSLWPAESPETRKWQNPSLITYRGHGNTS